VQGRRRRTGGRQFARQQQIGEQVVIAEPAALLIQRHQEYLVPLQVLQDCRAVMGIAQGIAEFGAESLEARGLLQEGLDLGGLLVDHLFQQVIADQLFGAAQRHFAAQLGQAIGVRQQPQAQPGDPAFAALDQALDDLFVETRAAGGNQRSGFLAGQAQVVLGEFEQLPGQAQTRQVPVRALAAGDQQQQAIGQVIEEELQAAVEHRALGQVIVVEHQQQGASADRQPLNSSSRSSSQASKANGWCRWRIFSSAMASSPRLGW
jgi:hypothetical protein